MGFKYRTALVTQVHNATRMHVYLLPLAGALCKVAYERASALVTAVDFLRVDMVVVWKKESMDDFGRLCQQSPMGTPVLMAIARVARLSGRANHANFIGGRSVSVSAHLTLATVARYFSTHTYTARTGPTYGYADPMGSTMGNCTGA